MVQALSAGIHRILAVMQCDLEPKQLLSQERIETLAIGIREKAGSDIGVAVIGDEDPNVGPYNKQAGGFISRREPVERNHLKKYSVRRNFQIRAGPDHEHRPGYAEALSAANADRLIKSSL